MSYAGRIKDEIFAAKPLRGPHSRAFAYGLLLFSRRFEPDGVWVTAEHPAVSKLANFAITDYSGKKPELSVSKSVTGEPLYSVLLEDKGAVERLFSSFGHGENAPNRELMEEPDAHAFLSGAFLACANITDPAKGYHLEFVPPPGHQSDLLFELLCARGYPPKSLQRRGQAVLYYKESEQIEDILTMAGAVKASLELMEFKIYKEVRNRANRVTNCETANIDKLVKASLKQVEEIRILMERTGGAGLSPELLELAEKRLQNPEASLAELARLLGVSRSGVNHRLKKISSLAEALLETEEERKGDGGEGRQA